MMFLHKVIELFLTRARRKPEAPLVMDSTDHPIVYNKQPDIYCDDFYTNLVIAIDWTNKLISEIKNLASIDYSSILRSTNPLYKGNPFYTFHPQDTYTVVSTHRVPYNYAEVLQEAIRFRVNSKVNRDSNYASGKILRFEIDLTTYDGAPRVNSDGFVDEGDIPPIDTWFFITTKYLYCWIPTIFIEKMQDAINVEVYNSYLWLEEVDPAFNQQLFERLETEINLP